MKSKTRSKKEIFKIEEENPKKMDDIKIQVLMDKRDTELEMAGCKVPHISA